jgi:hypothetical protein
MIRDLQPALADAAWTKSGGYSEVRPADDNACQAIAEEIQRQRPEWLVIWGCYSRRYWAYPLFPVCRRAIINASYPDALIPRLDEAERALRISPEEEEAGDGDCCIG